MINKIKPILVKEARQIMRDKLSLGIIIFIPVFMLGMFGFALSFDIKNISIGFYDEDKSKTSRDFINSFIQTEYFDYKYNASSTKEIEKFLQEGKIFTGVIIPSGFSKDMAKGITTKVQIFVDGSNSNTASAVIGYINGIISNYSKKILVRRIKSKTNTDLSEAIDYRPRIWYNPELKSVKFLVPGLIGFILLITSVISTSLSIVREKEKNTIEQIIVSPIKPYELIIGKTATYILIALITAVLIFIAGYFLFGIVIKGNYFLLFFSILVYLITSLGIGLLVSSISETQQVAFMISSIITLLPTFVLSGFVFPIRNMPIGVQLITYLVPARYFLVILRNIVLKGSGITSFWKEMLALILMSFVTLGLSINRLRKNII
jgi:ABC-2 type transport system permease protein